LLSVQELSRSFELPSGDRLDVLQAISFSLYAGEILCLLGASGCGKSTLLKLLAGLDNSSSGVIHSAVSAPGPGIGYLPQGEKLLPWRSILGNISLAPELLGRAKAECLREAEDLLVSVSLQDYRCSRPKDISGGMTQRALVARTLATKPKLLLLDEPLGQLDIIGRKEIAGVIKQYVQQSGAIAVVVTHSVEEAVFLGDKICILSKKPATVVRTFSFQPGSEGYLSRDTALDQVFAETLSILGG